MIHNVPGSALFETSQGSAASRSEGSKPLARIQAALPVDQNTGAHDETTRAPRSEPAASAVAAPRTTDDQLHGGHIDIRV